MEIDSTSRWPSAPAGLSYGGDYSPEQWDESVWHEDVALMRRAGVNLVNLGIFTWSLVEPAPGRFDFALMDRALELLHEGGVRVDLGTPTAAPPAWLVHQHPDILPMTVDGQVLGFGARESFCPSSPHYRKAAAAITSVLAERYGEHPALAMWHVHNEFGAHVGACYCPTSADAFRWWLQARYGTLAALNDAWGTTFWGQAYSDWAHIEPPRRAPMPTNPAQQLDFMRFTSEEYLACYRNELDVLRAITPTVPVTTNFMATSCKHIDYWQWVDDVDVVANDHYLIADDPRNHVDLAMSADLTRSLAHGEPWLLMEHSTGAVNWQPRNVAKLPGELRRNSLAHVARGADGVMFFQWRASRFGAEKFHSAMVPQAGTDSRIWGEVCQLGADLDALAQVRGSRVDAEVAIIWEWPSWWALELECRPSVDLSFPERVRAFYGVLWDEGVTVDFARAGADLSRYAAVFAPSLYLISEMDATNLHRYVEAGGTLIVSYFSGIVDATDRVHPGPYPGGLSDLLGLTVEEFHPLLPDTTVELQGGGDADVWSEYVRPVGAQIRDRFMTGPDAGEPAITRNAVGSGRAWYAATRLTQGPLRRLVREALSDAGVVADLNRDSQVETVRRLAADASYLFVINHDLETEATVHVAGTDLLTGKSHAEKVVVPPSGVAVIREEVVP